MPFPVEYGYSFRSIKVQLASSNLTNYLANWHLGPVKVPQSGSFPLRTPNGHWPVERFASPPKLASASILSGRDAHSPHALLRTDCAEDGSSSGDSDGAGGGRLSYSRVPSRRIRHRSLDGIAPILRKFLVQHMHGANKKRVKFADDLGLDLEEICFFVEELENWEPEVLPENQYPAKETTEKGNDLVVEIGEWQANFSQPAADYLGFRRKLDSLNVGLENVIIKKKTNSFMGTIKVKNVSFRKDVFVRCSFNNWDTFVDFPAKYCADAAADKYETFSFEIAIPPEAEDRHSVEFCVGFRTGGEEFWDNNSGRNYQLITSTMQGHRSNQRHQDAYAMTNIDSKFASWNQLENVQPYW